MTRDIAPFLVRFAGNPVFSVLRYRGWRTRVSSSSVVLGAALVWAGALQAEVTVCNDTETPRSIAIGYEAADGTWTSEGWWNVDPGACQIVMDGPLGRSDLYYRAEEPGGTFDGPFAFCTDRAAFTIRGDTECEDRGHDRARFRKIETDRAEIFTFGLIGDGRAIALDQDGDGAQDHSEPLRASGPLQRGQLGEPFSQSGIFVGCHTIDGLDYCGFEVEGWRYFAIYGGGTADSLLDSLQNWPYPMAVSLVGDMVSFGDITVEIALAEVEEQIGADPHADARMALQGTWRAIDDPASSIRINGADVYDYYNGDWVGHQWLQLVEACDGAEGLGIGVVRTELETQDSWCVILGEYRSDRIEFVVPGRGKINGYRRID